MKIAITGGTGFVGRHLASRLVDAGHSVVLVARGTDRRDHSILAHGNVTFHASDLSSADELIPSFSGCDAVAHLAGINRELGNQTFEKVHVSGTANVLKAAKCTGIRHIALLSFLRARPRCASPYHESKWAAEELVRNSGLNYVILKSGMIYGRGDHMLDHLSHMLYTLPIVATVGIREKMIRPVPIQDLINILYASLFDHRLSNKTLAVTGAEELRLRDAVRRIAAVLNRRVLIFPMPVWIHRVMARVYESTMKIPLVALAQVRILQEGVSEAAPWADELPADLQPSLRFTPALIRDGLPEPGPFTLDDLRCSRSSRTLAWGGRSS